MRTGILDAWIRIGDAEYQRASRDCTHVARFSMLVEFLKERGNGWQIMDCMTFGKKRSFAIPKFKERDTHPKALHEERIESILYYKSSERGVCDHTK